MLVLIRLMKQNNERGHFNIHLTIMIRNSEDGLWLQIKRVAVDSLQLIVSRQMSIFNNVITLFSSMKVSRDASISVMFVS